MATIGQYRGVDIPAGLSQADLNNFIKTIDAMQAGAAPSAPAPSPTPTAKSTTKSTSTAVQPTTGGSGTAGYGFGLGDFQDVKTKDTAPKFYNPPASGSGGSLLDFANALDAATNMAKAKRNALSLDIMMPSQGIAPASDFSGILSRLNNASDTTAANLTNRALEMATPQYTTQQIGNSLYQLQYDSSGRFVGQTKIADLPKSGGGFTYEFRQDAAGNTWEVQYDSSTGQAVGQRLATPSTPESQAEQAGTTNTLAGIQQGKTFVSGSLKYTAQDFQEDIATLTATDMYDQNGNPNRGADGWVNPEVYYQLYKQWIAQGGLAADFNKLYPIKNYINPANPLTQYPELKVLRGDKVPTGGSSGSGRSA